jgi:Streptomycin adenylyltransferase
MDGEFDGEVGALLDLLPRWAQRRRDIRAVALVGSWARQAPRPGSDVDVILLTEKPCLYVDREDWIEQLGGVVLVTTRTWGVITERRFRLPSGHEVDLGVGLPSWASVSPVDGGTRRVATDGLHMLYDPDGLLAKLTEHCPS